MWDLLPRTVLVNRKRGSQAADWFWKMSRGRQAIAEEGARLHESGLAAEAIDLKRLDRLIADWPDTAAVNIQGRWHIETYQAALTRGLAAGHFLRSFERNNR
jgi:asparagine synthase (glutamine-hydrolysing)